MLLASFFADQNRPKYFNLNNTACILMINYIPFGVFDHKEYCQIVPFYDLA